MGRRGGLILTVLGLLGTGYGAVALATYHGVEGIDVGPAFLGLLIALSLPPLIAGAAVLAGGRIAQLAGTIVGLLYAGVFLAMGIPTLNPVLAVLGLGFLDAGLRLAMDFRASGRSSDP